DGVELPVRLRMRRIAVEPVLHLPDGNESRYRLRLREPRRFRGGRRDLRLRRPRGGRADENRDGKRTHWRPPCSQWRRKLQSLLPTKLSGVTRTIAIACATIFPTPAPTRPESRARLARYTTVETTRKRAPWMCTRPRCA